MKPRRLARILIYALLLTGAVVYCFPYLWMLTSSFKVSREFMSPDLRLAPQRPLPRAQSPYVDERYFPELEGPHQEVLLPELAKLVRESGAALPADVDRAIAERQIARGLYKKLRVLLPKEVWAGEAPVILARARPLVDAALVQEVFASVYRRLELGPLRVRSVDLREQELGRGRPIAARWDNLTPEVGRLVDLPSAPGTGAGETASGPGVHAALPYDFMHGDQVILTRTYDLDFPAAELDRLRLAYTPDDTWHELWITVEMQGQRYLPRRPAVLGEFLPATLTWRRPSADDASNKLKTWVVLDAQPGQPSPITDPRQLRVTLELRRVTPAKAAWNKMALNYHRVSDQMPFGRYLRVSLFLVLANIVLTMFASSFVAYAFARLHWPGRDLCFLIMLATMMIPGQVTMIPHFLIWKNLGAYDTLTPLWLGAAFGNAFFIFMMRQFLKGIPRDLEDAACIDGCGFLRIYWHIMLPLVKPCLAAIAIFTFMGTWNNFMGPLIYIADQRLYPLALGLYAFALQAGGGNPPQIMAASLVMTLPVIAIFFLAQKYFIQGVTLTGMKG